MDPITTTSNYRGRICGRAGHPALTVACTGPGRDHTTRARLSARLGRELGGSVPQGHQTSCGKVGRPPGAAEARSHRYLHVPGEGRLLTSTRPGSGGGALAGWRGEHPWVLPQDLAECVLQHRLQAVVVARGVAARP